MFMEAVSHNPAFAKKVGVPQSVGREFVRADKGRKFAEGGEMKESKAMVKKEIAAMKRGKAPAALIKHEMAEMKGMKYGGKVKKMASGGLAAGHKSADGVAHKGKTKGMQVKMRKGGMC
jgi:hypothetical protein